MATPSALSACTIAVVISSDGLRRSHPNEHGDACDNEHGTADEDLHQCPRLPLMAARVSLAIGMLLFDLS